MPSVKAGPSLYTLTLPAYLSYLAQEVKGGGHGKSTKSTNTYCWTEMATNSALTHSPTLSSRIGGEGPLPDLRDNPIRLGRKFANQTTLWQCL